MKALAIDSAITQLTIALKNDDKKITTTYNIGMKQSETLLPAIDELFSKLEMKPSDLDYMTVTSGPGSFTGLRLAFAALKAIEMTTEKPIYGISTLECYAYNYKNLPFTLISCVDAKKERFYAKAFSKDSVILEEGDWTIDEIAAKVNEDGKEENILICGSDADLLFDQIKDKLTKKDVFTVPFTQMTTDALFSIAEEKIEKSQEPMKDFDGPVYLRASEAEVKLNS